MEFMVAIVRGLIDRPNDSLSSVVYDGYHSTLNRFHGFWASSAFSVGGVGGGLCVGGEGNGRGGERDGWWQRLVHLPCVVSGLGRGLGAWQVAGRSSSLPPPPPPPPPHHNSEGV
jgi:hypothetical protein